MYCKYPVVSWGVLGYPSFFKLFMKPPGAKDPTFGMKRPRIIFEMIPIIEKVHFLIMAPLPSLQFRPVSISEDFTCYFINESSSFSYNLS